jgi:hypothetical protein
VVAQRLALAGDFLIKFYTQDSIEID